MKHNLLLIEKALQKKACEAQVMCAFDTPCIERAMVRYIDWALGLWIYKIIKMHYLNATFCPLCLLY